MAISLHLGSRKDFIWGRGRTTFRHPKLSDIATQITRLRLFSFSITCVFHFLHRFATLVKTEIGYLLPNNDKKKLDIPKV